MSSWALPSLGRYLSDILVLRHLNRAVVGPGAVANEAEAKEVQIQQFASAVLHTTSTGVETLGTVKWRSTLGLATVKLAFGAVGESALDFLQELGRCIARTTAELRSFMFLYLMQRLLRSVTTPSVSPALHRPPLRQ